MRQNLLTYLNQVQALFLLLRDQSGCSRTIPTREADHNEGLALSCLLQDPLINEEKKARHYGMYFTFVQPTQVK